MSLQEAQYTFLDKGTPAAKRMTSEKITEFKGYNARGVREDGEMKDMSGLTSDEYPMLSVAKHLGEYGTATYTNPMQLLSKSHINDDGEMVDVLYAIASTAETVSGTNTDILYSGTYACYKNGTAISGLELSRDTQMVAINDKICFFPEKKWYSVKQGTVGNIEGSVSTKTTVEIADDEDHNRMSAVLELASTPVDLGAVFNVGDAVTISATAGTKMFCKLCDNEVLWDMLVSFNQFPSGSTLDICSEVPIDVPNLSITFYAASGETFGIGDYGIAGSLYTNNRYRITTGNYTGPIISRMVVEQRSGIRYICAFIPEDPAYHTIDGLWASSKFSSMEQATAWGLENAPSDSDDWTSKKEAWTLMVEANKTTIGYNSLGNIILISGILPERMGDVSFTFSYRTGGVSCLKSEMANVGTLFSRGIDGTTAVIQEVRGKRIVFPDNTFCDAYGDQLSGGSETLVVSISRPCPSLDFVIEWNNRLWGCSNTDNTIYCSKLGDPTNWQYYQNTSLDSYFAEQGSNGRWTGVGKYSTHLLFFKEDCVHKVYGNYPSEFQIVTQMCSGVREGSHKSVVTMEDGVLYHSRRGIMAYTGGIPTLISTEFGKEKFSEAVAGTDGSKYYVALRNKSGTFYIFVYDVELGLWHRYIACTVSDMEFHDGQLLIASMSLSRHKLKCIDDNESEFVDYWYAVFGPFDEYIENEKIYSVISIRYELATGKKLKVQISTDDGAWEQIEEVTGGATTGHEIEFIPERCDRFAIRLSGDGECKIKSLSRDFRVGSVQKENY